MISAKGGAGSVRSHLLLIAIVPLLALLPLGIRMIASDYAKWDTAGDRDAAMEQVAGMTVLEEVLRAEWLRGLDRAGLSSDDAAAVSILFTERAGSTIGLGLVERYDAAVAATDAAIDTTPAAVEYLESGTAALAAVRERTANGDIIPAEVDLFYSRLLRGLSELRSESLSIAISQAGVDTFDTVQAQAAMGDLAASSGRLQQQLTVAIGRGIGGGEVDWKSVGTQVDEVIGADAEITELGFVGNTSWIDARIATAGAADNLRVTTMAAPAAGSPDIELVIADLVNLREQLTASAPALAATRIELLDALVALAEGERSGALRGLLFSAILVLFGTAVTAVMVTRAHRSIVEPLTRVASVARRLSRGEIPDERIEPAGPSEVREVSETLGDLADTMGQIGTRAQALNRGDLADAKLDQPLPGALGAELARSISTWRDTTLRLDHELAHDPLTGIASSRKIQKVAESISVNGVVTIAEVAIDRFKDVNDAAGRATGDHLLRIIAERLEQTVGDQAVVGRLWSDEFAIVVDHDDDEENARLSDRVRSVVAEPISSGGRSYRLTATVGVASGTDADEAITNAAIASREGKRTGGDTTVFFDEALIADLDRRSQIEAELLQAIENDHLTLWFQPVVDAKTGVVTGAEALVRWPLADGTMRQPGEFIPIAEQSNLIIELDRYVLNKACEHLAEWQTGPLADLELAVNVSARHLADGDVPSAVAEACQASNVNPRRLGIEVTESYLADDRQAALATLNRLRELGVTLLIDDFGTGYSSLAFLQDLPFDVMKIDRAFVQRLPEGPAPQAIVEAMVSLARSLGMRVLGEGCETPEEIALLQQVGCGQLQGFGVSGPIPLIADLEAFCAERNPAATHNSKNALAT